MVVAQCSHVTAYRNRTGTRGAFYQLRVGLLCLWKKDANLQARLRQTEQTPIVCVNCASASTTCTHHRRQHFAAAKTGHELAVDLQHDQLYCAACNTYVYDATFNAAIKAARASSCASADANNAAEPPVRHDPVDSAQSVPGLLKRKRSQTGHEQQPAKKAKQLNAPSEAVQMDGTFGAGLRGLNNLGNTCFMNSILQVFLHVPLLRTFFLGGGHMHQLCPHLTPPHKPGKCLSCELDNIFSEAYSGLRVPFSPVRFLDTWWRSAEGSLAGYQQQDAHEFYLSLLDGLSQPRDRSTTPSVSGSPSPAPRSKSVTPTSGGAFTSGPLPADVDFDALNSAPSFHAWGAGLVPSRHKPAGRGVIDLATSSSSGLDTSSQSREEEDIESTMDQIFGGVLRSDVVCTFCGYTSTAHDPFKDVSVDIPEPPRHTPHPPAVDTPKPNPVKGSGKGSKGNSKGSAGKGGGRGGKTSIAGVKRGADALFQKQWEKGTEPSEAALSDASAFPATTEASARCSSVDDQSSVAGREDTAWDQTVSSPQHPSGPYGWPPTPDPPQADSAHMTHSLRPPPAPAAAEEGARAAGRTGKRAKLEEDVKHSAAADNLEGAQVGFDDGSAVKRDADVADKHDSLSPGGGVDGVGALPWGEGSLHGQGSGRGPEGSAKGFKGLLQGPGKAKGLTKGQRPSTAPVSPVAGPGKVVKPTRCQKCHTCRHKQLKKQCLRNKALNSPTKKNIDDALQGGVEAAELTPILPPHLQPLHARSRGSEAGGGEPAHLAPVLHGSKHRQAALRQRGGHPSPPAQPQSLGRPPAASQAEEQRQHQGSGKLPRGPNTDQGCLAEEPGAIPAGKDEEEGHGVVSMDGMPHGEPGGEPGGLPSPPAPLPVKAHPHSRLDSTVAAQDTVTQQQQQQQQEQQQQQQEQQQEQQQQQQHGAAARVDLAQQAKISFKRSTSQQQRREVNSGGSSRDAGVLLQACLHRFVRPETLHRWTCSRCQCQRSATKQMSIRQLPPVLCLHMKRFKATDKGATVKVESRVAFPVAHLDMAPFTSAPVLAARCRLKSALSGQGQGQGQEGPFEAANSSTAYSLHAVVCHTGNLLGGHYIGYVRSGLLWYQFDDARVTLVPEQHVRTSNAYMLFYLQK